MSSRPYQVAAVEGTRACFAAGDRSTLVVMPTGCHRAGQLVLMASGERRRVEDIRVGEQVMGPNSMPRTVLELARGRAEMVEVRPTKGDPWVVNLDHVLTLVRTPLSGNARFPSQRGGALVDVTVREWLTWSKTAKHTHKLLRVGVEAFPARHAPKLDAYVLGVMLGDGGLAAGAVVTCPDREVWAACEAEAERWDLLFVPMTPTNRCHGFRINRRNGTPAGNPMLDELGRLGVRCNSHGKRVPEEYLLGSLEVRLGVLAGLLDTDGHSTGGGYDFVSSSQGLAEDVAFLARSLGLAAYLASCQKGCQTGKVGTYWRVQISGDCTGLPLRVERKKAPPRLQKKNALRTGFTVHWLASTEDYFGFRLDGDQRYLLGDFTVTHNSGKTHVFSEVARRTIAGVRPTGQRKRVLVLAHRKELLGQAQAKLRAAGCEAALEQAGNHAGGAAVVVASVQTMTGKRLESWARDTFDLIIPDEAHHAVTPGHAAIFDWFAPARIMGVTATPDRADGKPLGKVFQSVAYRYELRQAIRDGWLVPFVARRIDLDGVDLSGVRTSGGDLRGDDLGAILGAERVLHATAVPLLEQAGSRKTIVFCADVAHAHRLAEVMNRYRPGCARGLDGKAKAPERDGTLAAFGRGEFQFLMNCQLLTEGFDMPSVSCVAVVRPTQSRGLWTQMAGRGSRLDAGKSDCLLLDYAGNSTRHRLIGPADVLAGRELDDEVAAEIASRSAEDEQDLEQLLLAATDAVAARRDYQRLHAVATYLAEEVDPFIGADEREVTAEGNGEPATMAQRELLVRLMSPKGETAKREELPEYLTRSQAAALISRLEQRAAFNLCTFPQARLLRRQGIDPRNMSAGEASRRIADLRALWSRKASMRRGAA